MPLSALIREPRHLGSVQTGSWNVLPLAPTKEGKRTLSFRYSPKDTNAGAIIEQVRAAGLVITDLSTDDRDLEDVFLHLTRDAA